ncbi:MAG: response regulator transcription factor [Chloroflexota bacterium]|nr:response regulator transcription factor [Chloroflexota bacterium]
MKRSTVLVIEADTRLSRSIAEFLETHTYQVTIFADAPGALDYLQDEVLPNIVLLGMNLPSISGFETARRLKMTADVPIIFLMSRSDRQYLVEGLKKYAEDFVIKPVELHELETRIQIVLGRLPALDYSAEPIIRIDAQLSIDLAQNRALVAGHAVRLTPTEAVLMHVLLRHAPRVVQNHALLARVWPTEEVYEDTLRVHMHRLRRKLEADSHHPRYILTERGVGYRFTIRPANWPADES